MWHASVAPVKYTFPAAVAEQLCRVELEGVGDAQLGEWVERSRVAVHIRRRLSAEEQLLVGAVVDLRATAEGRARYDAMRGLIPAHFTAMAEAERDGR